MQFSFFCGLQLILYWQNLNNKAIEYNGEDEPIIVVRVHCRCEYFSVWITLIFALILAEVTGVVVLSLLNHRVNRRHFQTTKSVNLMIYLIALLCVMGIGLAFVFQSLDIHYTYVSWQFSLLSIVCLVCVFMFSSSGLCCHQSPALIGWPELYTMRCNLYNIKV